MSKEHEKQRRWVCYYRVSTQRQGESGLGLDAQRKAVETYLSVHSGSVLAAFTETESGKRVGNRPELQQALDLCRRKRATLVIAKLDRLARNVHFISGLLESGCDFVAVDQPTKDRFMLHVQAAFAEEESRRISLRTKEALAAAKLRGIVIGASGRGLAERHKTAALNRAKVIMPMIEAIQAAGFTRLRQIRDELNRRRVPSPGGSSWHLPTIHKTLQRIAFLKSSRVPRH